MFNTLADAALTYTLSLDKRRQIFEEIDRLEYLLSLARTELGKAIADSRLAETALRDAELRGHDANRRSA